MEGIVTVGPCCYRLYIYEHEQLLVARNVLWTLVWRRFRFSLLLFDSYIWQEWRVLCVQFHIQCITYFVKHCWQATRRHIDKCLTQQLHRQNVFSFLQTTCISPMIQTSLTLIFLTAQHPHHLHSCYLRIYRVKHYQNVASLICQDLRQVIVSFLLKHFYVIMTFEKWWWDFN